MKAETLAALQDGARQAPRRRRWPRGSAMPPRRWSSRDKADRRAGRDAAVRRPRAAPWRSAAARPSTLAASKIFLNVYVPPPRLIIVGAVHIAQSLAPMATMLDFDVTVVDPRGAWATANRFPGVKVMQDWADEAFDDAGPRRLAPPW